MEFYGSEILTNDINYHACLGEFMDLQNKSQFSFNEREQSQQEDLDVAVHDI